MTNYIDFLTKCKHLPVPVDIESMIKHLGIKVYYSSFTDFNGFTIKDDHGTCVLINDTLLKSKQRFTLAHELKHCLEGEVAFHSKKHNPNAQIEKDANYFAGKLLVSDKNLRFYCRNKTKSITELASIFWVPEKTIRIRLQELKMN